MRRKASSCSTGGSWEDCLKPALPLGLGFPFGSGGKESTCTVGVLGLIPGLGRSPGEGKGYPLQYSGLENSINRIVHALSKSQTQLSDFHFISLHWASLKGPFESYRCYLFDKKNLIFHSTKGAFCKADLGILKKKLIVVSQKSLLTLGLVSLYLASPAHCVTAHLKDTTSGSTESLTWSCLACICCLGSRL